MVLIRNSVHPGPRPGSWQPQPSARPGQAKGGRARNGLIASEAEHEALRREILAYRRKHKLTANQWREHFTGDMQFLDKLEDGRLRQTTIERVRREMAEWDAIEGGED